MHRKAQGTIEYLVILAVIVVVSLIVVSLMINSTAPAQGISGTTAQIASVSSPIAITESIVDEDGNYFLKIGNNTGENVTISEIQIGGNPVAEDLGKPIFVNSEEAFVLSTDDVCVDGQLVVEEVVIVYENEFGLEKRQTYPIPINFECSPYETTVAYTDEDGVTHDKEGGTSGGQPPVVDSAAPSISLTAPENNSPVGGTSDFSFTVNDESSLDERILLINSIAEDSIVSPSLGSNTISLVDLSSYSLDTPYSWDINCIDEYGNNGLSGAAQTFSRPSIFLSSSVTGEYKDGETLEARFNMPYNAQGNNLYNWYSGGSISATNLIKDSRLAAYYPMNNDTKNYSITQDSAIVGTPVTTSEGKLGGAYVMGPTDGALAITTTWGGTLNTLIGHGKSTNSGGTTNTTGYTMSMWFNLNTPVNSSDTDARYLYQGGNGLKLAFNEGYNNGVYSGPGRLILSQHYYWYAHTSAIAETTSQNWNAGEWHHVAAIWNLSNIKLYVDGSLQDTTPMTLAPQDWWGPPTLGIGATGSGTYPLQGTIDEFIVYNQALSEPEIQQLYYGGLLDGNKLDESLTGVGENWKIGLSTNTAGGDNWSSETQSAEITIISD